MDKETLRARAVTLRRAGKSRREIKEELGIPHNWLLDKLLQGEPPPEWTKRPNAKDDLREKARELRSQGWTYRDIGRALGVSISTCSLWLRDLPAPPHKGYDQERVAATWRAQWERVLHQRAIERMNTKLAAAREVGDLTVRDVLVAGALVYWCEGSKDKPYRRSEKVVFINSDPGLIRFFVRFLDVAGVHRDRRRYAVHIHETADAEAATRYWAQLVAATPAEFQKPIIKRHNPKTNRKNLRDPYRGCLKISVLQSAELYRQIEGWAFGTMLGGMRNDGSRPSPAASYVA